VGSVLWLTELRVVWDRRNAGVGRSRVRLPVLAHYMLVWISLRGVAHDQPVLPPSDDIDSPVHGRKRP